MRNRNTLFILLLCLGAVWGRAAELHTEVFAKTLEPKPETMKTPRALVADVSTRQCYVLDSGLRRVVSFNFEGEPVGLWSFESLGVDAGLPMPADPLLPQPALAVVKKTTYLLTTNRKQQQVELTVIDGTGTGRAIDLPDAAVNGAIALDNTAHLLVAYLHPNNGRFELVLGREGDDGAVNTVAVAKDPCDGQVKNLTLTGLAAGADGRVAVGLAQSGDPAYGFVRSWLVQTRLQGEAVKDPCKITHRFSLVDQRGKISERFRLYADKAGHDGFPARPCVPLFTALAFGTEETIISGGHTADPFLRIYDNGGRLVHSMPWHGVGGQHIATASTDAGGVIFAASAQNGCVIKLAPDGRLVGQFGTLPAYDLSQPISLAADEQNVNAIVRCDGAFRLLRFNSAGRFLWSLTLTPPTGVSKALPQVMTLPNDRALIGWRLPECGGLLWAETVTEDGLPGLPFWREVVTRATVRPTEACPTPMVLGENGRLYLLRETKDGPRLLAVSPGGVVLQQFPPEIQGITAVAKDGSLSWAHQSDQGMVISRYTALGAQQGWRLVPHADENTRLYPVLAENLWTWHTSSHALLQMDESMHTVSETRLLSPEGDPLEKVTAICGNRDKRIYLAVPGRILVANEPKG